jgi:putative ABC transport system permease protein
MTSLFGIPMDTLALVLSALFAGIVGTIAVLAARNPILLKLGLRKIPRSRGRSALIVAGLMLATTIITAALSTGDTMTHTIRNSARLELGQVDEVVASARFESGYDPGGTDEYFDSTTFDRVAVSVANTEAVDGVAPAIIEVVAIRDLETGQLEPRVNLFATDPAHMAGFGTIHTDTGDAVTLEQLDEGTIYLNSYAADELDANTGDALELYSGGQVHDVRVEAIVDYEGTGTTESAILMPLTAAQGYLGQEGRIKQILVSNRGGALDGASHTDEVTAAIEPAIDGSGLEVHPVKQDAVDLADEVSVSFVSFFTTFGMFSIIAGILLIFLLFVMLAAERKPEIGIARAVGTQRSQVVRMFLYEGLAYDLVAAAVGSLVGVGVAFAMVYALANAFGDMGLDIKHHVELRSLLVAYTIGMVLTFITVAFSAWRVSGLNIVAAVRDLPEGSLRKKGGRLWWLGLTMIVLGVLMAISGYSARQSTPFQFGISIVVIGMVPVLRRVGMPDRLAFTLPGVALVIWWLLPWDALDAFLPEMSSDFSLFVLAGVMVTIGATWVVMYNSDLLLALITGTLGRIRALTPVVKTAISRPLTNRFRTGVAISMFGLVVLTLVVMLTTTSAFQGAFNDIDRYGGGYEIRAKILATSPIDDIDSALSEAEGFDASAVRTTTAQSSLVLDAHQVGTANDFEPFEVIGLDDRFIDAQPYGFATRAAGYESDEAVWHALATEPDVAVIHSFAVPVRSNFGFSAGLPDFQLEGFYVEDQGFEPVQVELRDPQTGTAKTVTIIGVLSYVIPDEFYFGILTNQQTLNTTFGEAAQPTVYYFDLADGAEAGAVASSLESAFAQQGMETEVLQDVLDDAMAVNNTFNYILQGFMGLGLVVGVAALAVISARSVVERRHELGMLRSIGFQRWMVYALVLIETSFVALAGIVIGFVLGAILSYNVITDVGEQPGWTDVSFALPWFNLAAVFIIVYVAALLTSLLPARRAANVYPAEALRYE